MLERAGKLFCVVETLETSLLLGDMMAEYNMGFHSSTPIDVSKLTFTANINRYSENGLTTYIDEDLFKTEFRDCIDDVFEKLSVTPTSLLSSFPTKSIDILSMFPNEASDMHAQELFSRIYSDIFIKSKLVEAIHNAETAVLDYFVSYREKTAKLISHWTQLHLVNYNNPSQNFLPLFKSLSLEFINDNEFSVERANLFLNKLNDVDFTSSISEKMTVLRANTLISKGMKESLSIPTVTEDDFLESINVINNKINLMSSILRRISITVRNELSVL